MSDSPGYSPQSHAPIPAPDISSPSIPVTSPVIPVESPAAIADIYSGTPTLHQHVTPTPLESQAIEAEALIQQMQAEQQQLQTQQQIEQQQQQQQQQQLQQQLHTQQQLQQQIEQLQQQLQQATSARSTEVFSPYSQSQRQGSQQTHPPGYEQQDSHQQQSAGRNVAVDREISKRSFVGFVMVLIVAQAVFMLVMMANSPVFSGVVWPEFTFFVTPENEGVSDEDSRRYTNEAMGISFTLSEGWNLTDNSSYHGGSLTIRYEGNYNTTVEISEFARIGYGSNDRPLNTVSPGEFVTINGITWQRIISGSTGPYSNTRSLEVYTTELPNSTVVLFFTITTNGEKHTYEDAIDMLNSLEFID